MTGQGESDNSSGLLMGIVGLLHARKNEEESFPWHHRGTETIHSTMIPKEDSS